MADMFEYLKWRGDIPFSQLGINDVDALLLSALAYIQYDGIISDEVHFAAPMRTVAKLLLAMPDADKRCPVPSDLELLKAAAETERFGKMGITFYQDTFIPEKETQFAAITFLADDGSAILSFRGTDNTLVGWKEDFNMTFQEQVPAQVLAQSYVQTLAASFSGPLYLTGHSKGGNLAVFAGAKCDEAVQQRIIRVYNHDGPGFTENMMTDPGYLRIVPKVRTLVPQSSVFGMLLQREEDYSVIRSRSVGLLQHDPYSWELMGKDFLPAEELTADSRFLDRTFKTWLAGLTAEERNQFFDSVFDLLMQENASRPVDVLRPQNMLALFKTMQTDEQRRNLISSVLLELVESAKASRAEMAEA